MYKKFIFPLLFVLYGIFIFVQIPVALAKSVDEYIAEANKLITQQEFDKAHELLLEGYQIYEGDIEIVFALATTKHLMGDYETAIANYINLLDTIEVDSYDAPGELHHKLVDAYNELGQKHYFSEELCLRIIYHSERVLELMPEVRNNTHYMEFLRKSIGHFDVAKMGTTMLETGGDGAEFQLPPDSIDLEEKLRYKAKAIQRLKNYDALKVPLAEVADKTIEELARALTEDATKITSIHYKEINNYMGKVNILDEVFYEKPNKFKTIQKGQIFLLLGNIMYSIDSNANKIYDTSEINEEDIEYFDIFGKINILRLRKNYDLTLGKAKEYPDSLKSLYDNIGLADLYIVTAKLKKSQEGAWPPINKVEYFIDFNLKLIVAKREYWAGVLGSGREEELAKETIVEKVQNLDNIYLPLAGTTRGFVDELVSLKEDWTLEIISLNEGIDDIEFDITKFSN